MFWLGLHHADWLERVAVPAMLSYRTLKGRKSFPRALGPWVQDSGGFTELTKPPYAYRTSPRDYANRTRLHAAEIGQMQWAAVQDWMCEDLVLGKTCSSVAQHQVRTLASYLDLQQLAPELPWLPVLQGRELDDYRRHLDMYASAGVDLRQLPVVGLGTVCRRQHTLVAVRLLQDLAGLGLRLHGFGLKVTSLLRAREMIVSADSMAWSLDGQRNHGGRCARVRGHDQCSNCLDYALRWRQRLLDRLSQELLWDVA
jgi:hypothetical protein